MANEHIINNNIVVSGSISSSIGFFGDGSGLTSITATAEWDGSRNGNASITGSLVVSGSNVSVDFSNAVAVTGSFSGSMEGNGSGLTNLNINGAQASGSILSGSFSGSYIGDGSGLTGLNNFPFTGNAVITGSLLVSGGLVNLTDTTAISGSVFSGSFVGNGSGLTNVSAEWDGSRNGDSSITGSLVVSGSSPTISLLGETTIDKNILISNRNQLLDISIGSGSLPNSTVSRNTLTIGVAAGANLISGSENVYLGNNAGKKGVATNEDVAVGTNALCSNCGVEIGDSTCSGNTAVGHNAMQVANSARENVALGYQALYAGTPTGQVAVGYDAARMGAGIYGVFVGYKAGITNQGSYNVVVGSRALTGTSSNSVAIGRCALGFKSGVSNNVAVGHFAGKQADTNSRCNVYLGHRAGPATLTQENNQLYIANAASDNSGSLIRGDFRTGQVTVHSQVSASLFSGSFVGDGSGLSGISGAGFPFNGDAVITGSLLVSQSNAASTSVTVEGGHVILRQVSASLNAHDDAQAALLGVPKGGLYRNGNFIQIRIN
jgi:hypothetical protein